MDQAFFIGSILVVVIFAVAFLARYRRVHFQRTISDDEIVPLVGPSNKIIIKQDSPTSMTVWTIERTRLFRIEKHGSRWHLSDNNKKIISTITNKTNSKFIVMSNVLPQNHHSPLGTTPSIIKQNYSIFGHLNILNHEGYNTEFQYGTRFGLRWVGLRHFEIIIPRDFDHHVPNESLRIHQRVAFASEFDYQTSCYTIWFDYDRINVEILISTFLLSVLNNHASLNGNLNRKMNTSVV